MAERLVLASASTARARLLVAAGLSFTVAPAALDETAIKQRFHRAGRDALDCAAALAEAKARHVASDHPGALVIGADQILVAGDAWLDKPVDRDAARTQLCALRGTTHALETAVCVVQDGACLWQATAQPLLTMRAFSTAFLDAYVAAEGAALLQSVGAYRLEDRGVQLFSTIEGDHFAIQGLPLVPLLGFLRARGVLPS